MSDGTKAGRACGRWAALAAILVQAGCASVYRKPEAVAGRYVHPAGMSIEIRADGTFRQQDPGGLGTPPAVQGRWRFLDRRGLIVANTYQQPEGYPIATARSPGHADVRVTVLDWRSGAPLAGVRLQLQCHDPAYERECPQARPFLVSDANGEARFPACACSPQFLFALLGPRDAAEARWEIKDAAVNEITVKVDPTVEYFITGAVWLVSGGKLYIVDGQYPLQRRK